MILLYVPFLSSLQRLLSGHLTTRTIHHLHLDYYNRSTVCGKMILLEVCATLSSFARQVQSSGMVVVIPFRSRSVRIVAAVAHLAFRLLTVGCDRVGQLWQSHGGSRRVGTQYAVDTRVRSQHVTTL